MIEIEEARGLSEDNFKALTPTQQIKYIKEHPNSKYAKEPKWLKRAKMLKTRMSNMRKAIKSKKIIKQKIPVKQEKSITLERKVRKSEENLDINSGKPIPPVKPKHTKKWSSDTTGMTEIKVPEHSDEYLRNKLKAGDIIKSYDFPPREGFPDRYVKGRVAGMDIDWIYIDVDEDTAFPDRPRDRIRTPLWTLSDWEGRICLYEKPTKNKKVKLGKSFAPKVKITGDPEKYIPSNWKELSRGVAVGKAIKKWLKSIGIDASVRKSSYSAVDVYTENLSPEQKEQIEHAIGKFQMGHFDGMTDSYDYSNHRNDIPQVEYVFLNNNYSKECEEAMLEFLQQHGWTDKYPNAWDAKRLGFWG